MGDVSGVVGSSAAQSALRSAAIAAEKLDTNPSSNVIKGVLGATSLGTLLFGLRSAWRHTKQPEAADLARAQIFSGVGFATRALGVATVITVSGFSLLVVGVSWALNVNTPRQFGAAMKAAFGDSLRLPQSKNSQSFEELILSVDPQAAEKHLEEQQQKEKPKSN